MPSFSQRTSLHNGYTLLRDLRRLNDCLERAAQPARQPPHCNAGRPYAMAPKVQRKARTHGKRPSATVIMRGHAMAFIGADSSQQCDGKLSYDEFLGATRRATHPSKEYQEHAHPARAAGSQSLSTTLHVSTARRPPGHRHAARLVPRKGDGDAAARNVQGDG